MRSVIAITDGKEYMLHSIYSSEYIYNDEWSEEMGKTPTFKFSIAPTHIHVDKIVPLSSEIKIMKGEKTEFFGRVINPQSDIYNTGTILCIGGLSYLADSVQRPFSMTGSLLEFFTYVIEVHNGMVEEKKRFKIGIVNVAGTTTERSLEGYQDTLTVLNAYLVDEYGGYLRVREESDGRYVDYLEDYGGSNSQTVRFGENLIDLSKQINVSEVITCLIPIGATVEVENSDGTINEHVVNIKNVNGGKDYIVNQTAIDSGRGQIWGSVEFEGVTDPEDLLSLAEQYLIKKSILPEQFDITAFDLSAIDLNVEAFELGKWTQFVSQPHGISEAYLLKGMVRHITAPQNDRIFFGGTRNTISGATASSIKRTGIKIEQMRKSVSKDINRKLENATQLITGGLGGYVVIGRAGDGHPDEIMIMDAPEKSQAKNVIRLNKNGLGFSKTGYEGPYENAWTIDGNLVADFITTGTMLADRIRGGILELGGSGIAKDGQIILYDANNKQIAVLDKNGVSASKGKFSGTIQGAVIKAGKNYDVSQDSGWMLYVNDSELNIGNCHVIDFDGRYIFETDDGYVGMSPRSEDQSHLAFWAAYNSASDYGFGVTQSGTTRMKRAIVRQYVEVPDIYLGDLEDKWGDEWKSLSKNIIELWEKIEALKS